MKKLVFSKEFEKPVKKRETFEELPSERWGTKFDFMGRVERFAERWEVDVEVFEDGDRLETHFYLDDGRLVGLLKLEWQRLVEMSDELCFLTDRQHSCVVETVLIRK